MGNGGMVKQHVFISYCRDNQSEVAKLRDDLIQAGEKVWWDQDILPGYNWESAINDAIKQCYAFVACLSKKAEARFQSGIYPEIDKAIERYRTYAPGKPFIILVRLSKCKIPSIKIDATSGLDKIQYVDLFPPSKRSAGLQKLIRAIQATPEHPP